MRDHIMTTMKRAARTLQHSTGLLALAAAAALAAPAQAQDSGDEIIVVAQKRAENIQDVPISVSAVTGEELASVLSGGGDVLQLAGRTPGLYIESSNGRVAPRFYIRGLGNTDFDLAASQPVSVIMDDVVMENVALKSFPLFDIAQVEVLRGPQGTLYGRNTPAGIVNLRSNRPTQDFDARGSLSWGTYNTINAQAAVGGPIAPTLSGRVALLYAHRDDWVDNAFTGESEALGEYDEVAGRAQLLWEPTAAFSALLNLHARDNEGTSSLFRANVFTRGSNELNENFDRDTVFFDGGNNNPQEYKQEGAALTLTYDFGGAVLTSITGYDTAEGRSLGDIDGGNLGGPGFIPFPSETQDSLDDLTQLTQEIRLASPDEGPFTWQVGAYYFDSEFSVTTEGPAFPPRATVEHTNESWAIFGQAAYDVTERLNVALGVRYTDDEKELTVPLSAFPIAPVALSGSQTTWDLSAVYELTPEANLYARIATGFRAPTIQGRDIAFFGLPSTADAETITSYEAGVKADVLDGTGRINAAVFYYEVEDQQFSAIGGGGNFTRLVNAEKGEAYGVEIEADFDVTENLTVFTGFAWNHTEIQDTTLAVLPCGAGEFNPGGNCTVLDPVNGAVPVDSDGDTVSALVPTVSIDGNPFPNAPEFTWDIGARYERALASGGTFFAETDWVVLGSMNFFLYESVEFQTDVQFEGGLKVGYISADERYEFAVFGRNITDEENTLYAIDFNNLTGLVNEPRVVGVSVSARY